MTISLGDSMSVADLTAIADYQAQFPPDQIAPGTYAGGYTDPFAPAPSSTNTTSQQLLSVASGIGNNSTLIVGVCAILGLIVAMKK